MPQRGLNLEKSSHTKAFSSSEITPTRCWASYSNGFCFRNMIPCSFDYLIYPYYPAYTMGCYQIVISGDNGRQSILLFLCWFTTLIIAQKAGKCNCILRLFQSVHHPNKLESGLFIEALNPLFSRVKRSRCRSSQEINDAPTPFSALNYCLPICAKASFSLSKPNIAAYETRNPRTTAATTIYHTTAIALIWQ